MAERDYTNIIVSKDEWFVLRERVTRIEGRQERLESTYQALEHRYDELLRQFGRIERQVNSNTELGGVKSISAEEAYTAYREVEVAIQLLTGNILNLRTELLVIKAAVVKEQGASDE